MTTLTSEPPVETAPLADLADERLTFPCSSSQLRCWFVNAVTPGNPALNVALRWELKGTIDRSTIAQAFERIVARHEILRTRIVETDGAPVQEVLPRARLPLSEIDLAAVAPGERIAQALERGRAEARRPFDLTVAPLLRVLLLRLAPDHAFLFVTVHQIAFDGWSIRLLSTEFAAIAAALSRGTPPGLPELPMQYGDYAAWQKAYLDSGTFDTERTYWRRQLTGAPFFEVPGDRERPLRPTSNCEIIATHVPPAVTEGMMRIVKQRRVTLFSFGCAVIATALRHATGAEDISIGTQVSGRDDADLDPLIGVFINNLVLRFDAAGDPTFLDRLERANGTVQDALVHQRMPFHTLVDLLKPPRDPRRLPLISVNFTVLQDVMDDADCGAFDLIGQPSLSAGSLYDLNFFLVHWPATGWRMALEYNTDLFDPATARHLLDLWAELHRIAAERPLFRLSELQLPVRAAAAAPAGGPGAAVEAALLRHAAVAEAAVVPRPAVVPWPTVVPRPAPDGPAAFHAFVVPRRDYPGTLDDIPPLLKAHVGDVLPGTGTLDDVTLLMVLPRDAEGGPDRARLATMARDAAPPRPTAGRAAAAAPEAGAVEGRLTEIWTELLGTPVVRTDLDFFALGGHSLLAMRMLARAEAAFGLKVRLSDLLLDPTIAGLTAVIAGRPAEDGGAGAGEAPADRAPAAPAAEDWRLVEVRAPGADTAIFGIDSVKELHEFWEETGGDRGLYSVQMFEPGRQHEFGGKTFEEIAAQYLALIRRIQPAGPYRLFGLCVHGVLAYEIAQQMRNSGDTVELLAFKNAWHPQYFERLSWFNRWAIRLAHVRDNAVTVLKGEKSPAEFLANYSLVRKSGLLDLCVMLGLLREVPPRTGSQFNDAALLALMAARDAYEPQPYDGSVLQYIGIDAPRGRGFDPTLGWSGTITGRLTVRDAQTGTDQVSDVGGQPSPSVAVFGGPVASQPSAR